MAVNLKKLDFSPLSELLVGSAISIHKSWRDSGLPKDVPCISAGDTDRYDDRR